MRRSLRAFVVGLLVMALSFSTATACRHFHGHRGAHYRSYAPVYYGPVAYGGQCGYPRVVHRSYCGCGPYHGCGPYYGCGPCDGVVVKGAPSEREYVPAAPDEALPPARAPRRPAPPRPSTVDRPVEPAPELPPSPPAPDTFAPEPPPREFPEPVPPTAPVEDDIFGLPPEAPAEAPDGLFDATEEPPMLDETPREEEPDDLFGPPAEEPDDLFAPPPIPEEPAEPAEPIEPAEEPADEPFDFFDFGAADEEATDEMPAETEEQPEEVPAEEADDFDDDFFSDVLREPGGLASEDMRTWVDDTGNYSCNGRLVRFFEGQVRLLKDNGRTTTVPLSRLSANDVQFVNRQASALQAQTLQTAQSVTPLPRLTN